MRYGTLKTRIFKKLKCLLLLFQDKWKSDQPSRLIWQISPYYAKTRAWRTTVLDQQYWSPTDHSKWGTVLQEPSQHTRTTLQSVDKYIGSKLQIYLTTLYNSRLINNIFYFLSTIYRVHVNFNFNFNSLFSLTNLNVEILILHINTTPSYQNLLKCLFCRPLSLHRFRTSNQYGIVNLNINYLFIYYKYF